MPSQPVRILLVDMPRLVKDMLESAARSDPGVHVVGVLRDVEAIGAESAEDAEVIVVGIWNESPLRGLLLGSVAHKLLQLSDRPVVCVPGGGS
jgi:nucleotide-binding universal stress UspA family protein